MKYSNRKIAPQGEVAIILRKIAGKGFIAGSAARREIARTGERVGDIDIFCLTPEDRDGIEASLKPDYFVCNITDHATTLMHKIVGLDVQIIEPKTGRFGPVTSVLDNFDFTCNQAALIEDAAGEVLGITSAAFHYAVNDKRLEIVSVSNPVALVYRITKYAAKGYTLPTPEQPKVFAAWENWPLRHKYMADYAKYLDGTLADEDELAAFYALTIGAE